MKMVQINIFLGTYLDNLIRFLQEEKPDVVTMQEVTPESFQMILEETGLNGYFDKTVAIKEDKNLTSLGNAILTRGKIVGHHIVRLNKDKEVGRLDEVERKGGKELERFPRSLLSVLIEMDGQQFYLISTQLAVRKDRKDSPEKSRQANKVVDHLKSLGEEPFVIGGDFNAIPSSGVIKIIDRVAKNSFDDFSIQRTTHPTFHKTKDFLPQGLVIDYIYTSKHFEVKLLRAPVVDISDHLPLIADIEWRRE